MDESFYSDEEKRALIRQAEGHFRLLPPAAAVIDDKTWNDLSGDELFFRIDRCATSPGRSVLYARMRSPSLDPAVIESRRRGHEERSAAPESLRPLNKALKALGTSKACMHEYLESLAPSTADRLEFLYPAIAVANVFCFLSPLLIGIQAGGLLIATAVIASLVIYSKFKKKSLRDSESIYYVAKLIAASKRIANAKTGLFAPERARLGELAKRLKPLRERCAFFLKPAGPAMDFVDAALELFKMLFLLEAINYSYARSGCLKERPALLEAFDLVGGIDASLSVSGYLDAERRHTEAEISAEPGVSASGMIHPLLAHPVPNSISIGQRGAIITGTNMSGKSTFLRALGLNLVIADLSGYALASAFSFSPLCPISAINDVDDVLRGKSKYLGEAERLLQFIRLREEGNKHLFLIDEILSGTNSVERTIAATEILRYLAARGALTVAATHDLSIATELDGVYDNYHFDDEVTESGLVFDYRIKPGVVTKRNALKLLAFLGYPKEIVDRLPAADAK
jgi:hypothetical protein